MKRLNACFQNFRETMPVPMEEIVEELGAALDARFFFVIASVKEQSKHS